MAQDWQATYFRQARSDYDTFQLLETSGAAFCQQLHYLQMTTEKLAKGFASSQRRPELHRLLPGGPKQINNSIDGLLPYAHLIENLAPANANDGPNAEYPWQTPAGVIAPADYAFANLAFNARGMLNMLKFLKRCFQIIDQ